jgi:hypothetical protein
VATALLVGQALLCALIGWLTFGATRDSAGRAPAPVDPLAGAPVVIPRPNVPPPEPPPVPPPTSAPATAKATATSIEPSKSSSSRPAPSRSTPPPRPPGAALLVPPRLASTRAATPTPPTDPGKTIDPRVAPPTPAPAVQEPVVAGEPCDPAGALGRTADGVLLVCFRDSDGTLRWRVS